MGKFSLCQQTNVQEGFKKRHNKLALLAEPRQTPPPLNLGPVIGSYHGFEEIPKPLWSYLDQTWKKFVYFCDPTLEFSIFCA